MSVRPPLPRWKPHSRLLCAAWHPLPLQAADYLRHKVSQGLFSFTGKDFAVIHDLGPFFKGEARHVMDHLYIHQISTLAGETRKQALFEK